MSPSTSAATRKRKPNGSALSAKELTALLDQMVFIRRFEEAVQKLFLRGQVYGSTHLCMGQEGVSAGLAAAMEVQDWIAMTYRGHGHLLARGSDAQAYMDELLGRANGTGGGRAGSMNAVDLTRNIVGCFGIVGGSLAAATGVAVALKRKHKDAAAFACFGDGAANQAYFHECLNFAQAMGLPAVYVCENNGYGEYTPTEVTTPGGIAARPRALGIQTMEVDGQEAWTVRDTIREARAYAVANSLPAFVEARTYRFSDHGRGDPVKYRPDGEMERWRERDPIKLATEKLVADFNFTEQEVDDVVQAASRRIDEIVEKAVEAPFPDPATSVWTEFATPVS